MNRSMRWLITFALAVALPEAVSAACPTTSLTFKDAAGATQTLCFGGASGAFIPQYQILDSGGTNALGVNASGQITISNSAFTANAGTNLNTSALALDASVAGLSLSQASTTSGQKGALAMGAVTTAAPSYTTAQTSPLSLDAAGNLRTTFIGATMGNAVPANGFQVGGNGSGNLTALTVCDNYTPFSFSSTSAQKIIAKATSKKVYICSINIVVGAATNVALIEGTKVTNECDTSTAGMAGGTTAATGWNFAANGGLSLGSDMGIVAKTANTNFDVCLLASAANQTSGGMAWTQY